MISIFDKIEEKKHNKLIQLKHKGKMTGGVLFTGVGGETEGILQTGVCEVLFGINHDPEAIKCNATNHKNVVHYIYDIRQIELDALQEFIGIDFLWMSSECTHFSKAKGSSRDADSRALSEELYRYADYLQPNYLHVENVEEFLTWGPLIPKVDKKGHIVYKKKDGKFTDEPEMVVDPKRKGEYYNIWVNTLKDLGWTNYEYRLLNAADYGTPTSRKRYFGIFSKPGCPIAFPTPTHAKKDSKGHKAGLKEWVACREFIELNNEGNSIFGRQFNNKLRKNHQKPLVKNTLGRIAYGIKKFILNSFNEQLILKYYTSGGYCSDLNEPLHTIRTNDTHALLSIEKDQFINQYYGRNDAHNSINAPLKTITTANRNSLITVDKNRFLTQHHYKNLNAQSLNMPINTILTEDMKSLVTVDIKNGNFIEKHQFGKESVSDINEPLHTIVASDRQALISVNMEQFLVQHYSGNHVSDINNPLPTITTIDHNTLLSVNMDNQFIDKYFSGVTNVQGLSEPLATIKTNPSEALITAKISNTTNDTFKPFSYKPSVAKTVQIIGWLKLEEVVITLCKLIEKRQFFLEFFTKDIKIVEFLEKLINDIKMRFLIDEELKLCQGFPKEYILTASETKNKEFIGNSVSPYMSKVLLEANYIAYHNQKEKVIA